MTLSALRDILRESELTLSAARIGKTRRWVAILTPAHGDRVIGTGVELPEAIENALAARKKRKTQRHRWTS